MVLIRCFQNGAPRNGNLQKGEGSLRLGNAKAGILKAKYTDLFEITSMLFFGIEAALEMA
jgi:hypothetical protein